MNDYSYNFINDYNAQIRPSTVHCSNTGLVNYFKRYFLHKVLSCFEIEIPEGWARNYFEYALFAHGHAAVFDAGSSSESSARREACPDITSSISLQGTSSVIR